MKDFAKSIVCNVKDEVAKVGNYDPKDYENDPRHKWTIKSIENEIQKYKQRIELNRVRITQLRNMENSGNYPSSSRELKEEQKDYEANQMKVKQLVSMLRRATGNEFPEDMVGNKAFQEKTLQYAYEKAKSKGLSGKALEEEILRIATHAAPYASSAHSDSLRREVQEFLLKVGNSKVGNASTFDRLDDAVHYASNLTDATLRRLNGNFSATNLISDLSKCKQACDDAIKLAQQYDREQNK